MANGPSVQFWQVIPAGGGNGNINQFNGQGGPSVSAVNPTAFSFGSVEAGQWSVPQVLLVQFTGSTARQLSLVLYDESNASTNGYPIVDSTGEDWFDQSSGSYNPTPTVTTNWHMRVTLKQSWVDPTTISLTPGSTDIETGNWQELQWLPTSFLLDTFRPGTGNDGTTNLLTQIVGSTTSWVTNFFIYLAARPRVTANAGDHAGWDFRFSYIYP